MPRTVGLTWLLALGAIALATAARPATTAPTSSPAAVAAPSYTLVDLGSLGRPGVRAHALNAQGLVAGEATSADGRTHACLRGVDGLKDLGLAGLLSVARAVNASGQVTGFAHAHGYRAFLWTQGRAQELGTLGGDYSAGFALNAQGHVCGSAFTADGQERAFLWSDGAMRDLGTLGGTASSARGINARDQVVGFAFLPSGAPHAFLWSGGVMRDLGTLGGATSEAFAVDDAGDAVGQAALATGGEHAVRWSGGRAQDLGALGPGASQALATDPGGRWIVGASQVQAQDGALRYHAFVWSDGAMQDLNALVPAGSDWTLEQADAVNAAGQIAGFGERSDGVHAFLLRPAGGPAAATSAETAALEPAAPTPFHLWNTGANPAFAPAVLGFSLPQAAHGALTVYDVAGRRVRELAAGDLSAGAHTARWDLTDEGGRRVAAGAYFIRFSAGRDTRDLRLVVVR